MASRARALALIATLAACGARDTLDGEGGAASGASSSGSGTGAAGAGQGGHGAGAAGASGCGSRPGPSMVELPGEGGVRCIDATEVTNAHYAAFLASAPSVSGQPPACVANSSLVPAFGWPADGRGAYPVVNVDWCDARAYCAWAAKVLCPGDYAAPESSARSAWMSACSAQGTRVYPYGDAYGPVSCNGKELGGAEATKVASIASCEGGYPGIFDLSGNVWEWEDACENEAMGARCRVRGGGFRNDSSNVACAAAFAEARDAVFDDFGFRCCAY